MQARTHNGYTIISFGTDENRFNPTFVAGVNKILDNLEKGTKGLVFTGEGKFFSNGLDLVWMGQNPDGVKALLETIFALLARILVFPLPTVALINGHCFGAGAFISLCCDFRVMNSSKGFWNLPEVNIGLPLSTFKWIALLRLSHQAVKEAALTGKRFTAKDALALHIVDAVAPEEDLLPAAIKLISHADGKNLKNYGVIKKELFGELEHKLLNREPGPSVNFSKL